MPLSQMTWTEAKQKQINATRGCCDSAAVPLPAVQIECNDAQVTICFVNALYFKSNNLKVVDLSVDVKSNSFKFNG